MAARRPATTTTTTSLAAAVLTATLLAAAMERAEAGHNCICECMKLCIRTDIPDLEDCKGKCKETACIRSCEEACTDMGFPKQPHEGIPTCEGEPLSPDEQNMLPDPEWTKAHNSQLLAAYRQKQNEMENANASGKPSSVTTTATLPGDTASAGRPAVQPGQGALG